MNQVASQERPPQDGEALVAQELALRRARREAAERDTRGISTTFKVLTGILLAGSLVPVIGIFSLLAGIFTGAIGALVLFLKGNGGGAVRQLLLTVLGALAGVVAWAVVTFVLLAAA